MIQFIFEVVLEFVLEVVLQIVFEVAAHFGRESLVHASRREMQANPFLADVGRFVFGVIAGFLSLLVFGSRLVEPAVFPGVSLILSPLGTGMAMHAIGEFWRARGHDCPGLFTFRGGAVFAFGMALVRVIYFERHSF